MNEEEYENEASRILRRKNSGAGVTILDVSTKRKSYTNMPIHKKLLIKTKKSTLTGLDLS